jgi:multidrug transporter EmrE-like cation transporter
MSYLFLAAAFILNASANIVLKFAAVRGFSLAEFVRGEWNGAHALAFAAAVLFALNLLFYLLALRTIPLSVGYPVMVGMTFVITTGVALFLGERITLIPAIGLALILLGIVLVVRTAV